MSDYVGERRAGVAKDKQRHLANIKFSCFVASPLLILRIFLNAGFSAGSVGAVTWIGAGQITMVNGPCDICDSAGGWFGFHLTQHTAMTVLQKIFIFLFFLMARVFTLYDADGDGVISRSELRDVVMAIHRLSPHGKINDKGFHSYPRRRKERERKVPGIVSPRS